MVSLLRHADKCLISEVTLMSVTRLDFSANRSPDLAVVLREHPHTVLALCQTLHLYQKGHHGYILDELTAWVNATSTNLTHRQYRKLRTLANKFAHQGLSNALDQI